MRVLLTTLVLLLGFGVRGATLNSDGTSADTQAKINAAVTGDEVVIANGTRSWSTGVTIPNTKAITLRGNGTNACFINSTMAGSQVFLITVTAGTVGTTTVKDLTLTGLTYDKRGVRFNSQVGDSCPQLIECALFSIVNTLSVNVEHFGSGMFRMKHCMVTGGHASEMVHIRGYSNGDTAGWAYDVVPGSFDAAYIEYNTFFLNETNLTTGVMYDQGTCAIQSYNGARTVFRYNLMFHCQIDQHGTAGMIGARWWEIYGNTNYTPQFGATDKYMGIRAGSGVIFNNKKTGFANQSGGGIALYEEDSGYPALYQVGRGKNQTSFPAYLWNNTSPDLTAGGTSQVLLGRDFFNTTPPYQYTAAGAHFLDTGDTTPPAPSTAVIPSGGVTVEINWTEACTIGAGGAGGLVVNASGGAVTANLASGQGTGKFIYSLSRGIQSGETVTLDYTQPGSGIEDIAGNACSSFTGQTVQNNSTLGDSTPPTVVSAIIGTNGNTITFTWSEACVAGPGGVGGLTFGASGAPGGSAALTGTYVSGSGSTMWTWAFNRYVDYRETVTRTYVQPGHGIEDTSAAGNDLANFTTQPTVNASEANIIDILPPDRFSPYWAQTGIEGGIPTTFTVMFANVTQAPYNVDNTGVSDASVGVQAAIDACTSGQYVFMPIGTYRFNSRVNLKNNCVLRGAGRYLTVINSYANWHALNIGDFPSAPVDTRVANHLTVGTSNVSVFSVSTPAIALGDFIVIDQVNDGVTVTNCPDDLGGLGTQPQPSRDSNTRNLAQVRQVVAISGTNLTVFPPVTHAFNTNYATEVWELNQGVAMVTNAGFESFTVERVSPVDQFAGYNMFKFVCASRCWIQDVRATNTIWWHVDLDRSFRCQVFNSEFNSAMFRGGGAAYGVVPFNVSSMHRIEHNRFYRLRHAMPPILCSDIVFGYNFSVDSDQGDGWLAGDMFPHGAHATMVLFEGNYGVKIFNDWTHGSCDYICYFRNFVVGKSTYNTSAAGRRLVDNNIHATYLTFVGNVFGTNDGWTYTSYEARFSRTTAGIYIFNWDFVNDADGISDVLVPSAYDTAFRHANYDDADKNIKYALHYENHTLSNSLYLVSKPTWFGDRGWPTPFNNPKYIDLPAGYSYVFGTNPPPDNNPFPGVNVRKAGKIGRASGLP